MATSLGKYKLTEELGRGGMGTVYRAHDAQLRRDVALKVLPKEYCQDPVTVERFVREARALGNLHHPNLTAIYDVGEAGGRYFFAMELVKGRPLSDILYERGRLPWEEAVQVAVQILAGLEAAHAAGLIHRDLKPGNIMLNKDGRAILMDFGLAKRDGENSLTEDGIILGTPDYMSPEQAKGHTLDRRADLYSVGVVLFHILSGRVPYSGKSSIKVLEKHVHEPVPALSEIVHDLPEGLSSVVARLMAKKPEDRFQTAGEVGSALKRFVPVSTGIKSGPTASTDPEQPTGLVETLAATESSSLPNPGQSNKPRAKSPDSAAMLKSKVAASQRTDHSRAQLVIVFVGGAIACALCILLISGIKGLVSEKPSSVPVTDGASTTITATTKAATSTLSDGPSKRVRIEFIDGRFLEGGLVRIDSAGNITVEVGNSTKSQLVQLKMERIKRLTPQE
ncbi:MAG: serine/threonine-protein kinase [Planctomycetota bacterium]|nr:serine/threonine-protein kinase [Planctomycetota bacterium]